MNSNPIQVALGSFKENELIYASKMYREKLQNEISEAAFYKTLERMCKTGELIKIAKGTYHLPKISKYGIIPPSEKEIVSSFVENNQGTIIGYQLYNSLGITTQISSVVSVLSSNIEGFTKNIRNISVKFAELNYSEQINNMIHALEVLQNYYYIQDLNYFAFINYAKEISKQFNEKAFEEVNSVLGYKKSTISFLKEILNYYGIQNNLNSHLSSLSEYKHPKMEEIYEIARVY